MEKHFYLPTLICNHSEYIQENNEAFKRQFILQDNVEDDKVYFKHNKIMNETNECSDLAKVIQDESELLRLHTHNCPIHTSIIKYPLNGLQKPYY